MPVDCPIQFWTIEMWQLEVKNTKTWTTVLNPICEKTLKTTKTMLKRLTVKRRFCKCIVISMVVLSSRTTVDKIIELVGKNASLVILASSLQPPTPLPSPQVLGLKTRRLLQPSRRPATQPSVPTPGQARIDEIILYLFNKMFEY